MYAYDVDGDKDNDVITSLEAHGYGPGCKHSYVYELVISANAHIGQIPSGDQYCNDDQRGYQKRYVFHPTQY